MDVVCFAGIEKFLNCQRRDEIQETVSEDYGFSLSEGTVTNLGVEFLIRLNCYHKLNFKRLNNDMKKGGGYILGIDGTGDGGSDRLFIGMDSIRDWVLISERIPSESTENISPLLKSLIKQAGSPLAAVCDNGGGMRGALKEVMPNVSLRSCNYHFLKNVGVALMEDDYMQFRQLMINNGIQADLNRIRKKMYLDARTKGIEIEKYARMIRNRKIPEGIPVGDAIMSLTYDWICWVLRYYEDNEGLRFPYALPFLNLYKRCERGFDNLVGIRRIAAAGLMSMKYLENLEESLTMLLKAPEDETEELRELADKLTETNKLFESLRKILDIPKEKGDIPRDKLLIHSNEKILKMKKNLRQFRERLRVKSKDGKHVPEGIIVKYLDKYWDELILENAVVEVKGKKKVIEIPRTSGGNDTCFGEIKADIRKRLGKKDTGRELNRYGAYLGIVQNLRKEDYVRIMFGSLDDMPKILSKIPKEIVDREREEFFREMRGYDVMKNGAGEKGVEIGDIRDGIGLVMERVEEIVFWRRWHPAEMYGKKSNGLLTL
jgi:hypothetical protein